VVTIARPKVMSSIEEAVQRLTGGNKMKLSLWPYGTCLSRTCGQVLCSRLIAVQCELMKGWRRYPEQRPRVAPPLWLEVFRFVGGRIICDFDPGRCMIASLLPATHRAIDPRAGQPFGERRA
jgi:hypothetical protein